jgi:hypothetical protein
MYIQSSIYIGNFHLVLIPKNLKEPHLDRKPFWAASDILIFIILPSDFLGILLIL